MRVFTYLIVLLLISGSFRLACNKNRLNVNLSYITREKSKDSRTMREAFELKDGLLKYSYADNRSGKSNKKQEVKLSRAQIKTLVKTINENNLLRNLELPKQDDFEGPYTAVLLDCKIEYGTKKGDINIYCLVDETSTHKDYLAVEKLKNVLFSFVK